MSRNAIIFFSAVWAIIITLIDIIYEKFGGVKPGSRTYISSHSWEEVLEMFPQYLMIFFSVFIIAYIYYDYKNDD